jgi:integrase
MAAKGVKTTTYSLDWDVIISLETRLLRDFRGLKSKQKALDLLSISIGARLGLRIIDNLELKWSDLLSVPVGESFIRVEKKTDKERVLVMSTKLHQILTEVEQVLTPQPDEYIFSSQKGKGLVPMTAQNFNRRLKLILKEYKVRYIGNCSSHILRKSFVVGAIRKGFETGDYLSLVKVSKLVGHRNVSTTIRYTNFETSQAFALYELS